MFVLPEKSFTFPPNDLAHITGLSMWGNNGLFLFD